MMPILSSLLLLGAGGARLAVWRDPERALLVPVASIAPDLRESVASKTAEDRYERLLAILDKRPEDWQVHAVLRAEIGASGDVPFTKRVLDVAQKNSLKYPSMSPHWRICEAYRSAMAMYCAKLSERGGLNEGREQHDAWYRDGQHVTYTRPQDLRSLDDAYAVLSVYRNVLVDTRIGREYLKACERRFKPNDPGLLLYEVRLYAVGIKGSINAPKGSASISIDAPWDPAIVRKAALSAWKQEPNDPGTLAVAAASLSLIGDPLAPKAVEAYKKSNDPDPTRAAQLHGWYPKYFPR